jgi:hypothetical protein
MQTIEDQSGNQEHALIDRTYSLEFSSYHQVTPPSLLHKHISGYYLMLAQCKTYVNIFKYKKTDVILHKHTNIHLN